MRILLACPYAWDTHGGVQAHVRQLAAALSTRGHDVVVVAPARAPAHRDAAVRIVGRTVAIAWGGSVVPLCFSHRSYRTLRTLIGAFDPDVVHVHEPFAPSTAMLAALAAPASSVVATFHAFSERSWLMQTMAPLLRIVDPAPRRSRSPSRTAAARPRRARRPRGPVAIVPNGVAHRPLRRRRAASADALPRGRLVLWVNRLEPRKGFPIAVRAFAQLAAAVDDAHLVVVGDGPDRDALGLLSRSPPPARRDAGRRLGRRRCRATTPPPTSSSRPRPGRRASASCCVEAMAAALPVVASDIRGYREVVRDGVDGLLVPPNDPGALAAALRRVLTEPALAAALARAGSRARAALFLGRRGAAARGDLRPRRVVAGAPRERPYSGRSRIAADARSDRQRGVSGRRRNAHQAVTSSASVEQPELGVVPLEPQPRDRLVEHLAPRRRAASSACRG